MSAKHRSISRKQFRNIDSLILGLRGKRVILDHDLASVYGATTKRLNEQVRRNKSRFPSDFVFRLTHKEYDGLKSKIASSFAKRIRSQNATASKRNIRFMPYAFTEHGAVMAANVLNSKRAVQMSVFVVRAFIRMRSILANNKELALRLNELEKELKKRLDLHETAIVGILQRIMTLIDPPTLPEPKKRAIGF